MIRTANLLSGAAVRDLSSVSCLMSIWKRCTPYNHKQILSRQRGHAQV